MGILQLYIAIGLSTIAVLASLTVSLIQVSAIRNDIKLLTGKVYELMGDKRQPG